MKIKLKKMYNWFHPKKTNKRYSNVFFVESLIDVPESLENNIYIVEKSGLKKWAVFLCPCSKKSRIEVNLMTSRTPSWKIFIEKEKVSLFPSVVVSGKCRCHFWLRDSIAYPARFK